MTAVDEGGQERYTTHLPMRPWFLLCLLLPLGCGAALDADRGPRETLDQYAAALREGKAEAAYRLLSDEAKRSISFEAFRRMVEENPEDVADIAQALGRPGSDPVVSAVVRGPGGEALTLVYEDGRWTVDGTGIDRYGQATPRQALEGFVRAFERKRFDILMRYVPQAEVVGRPEAMWGEGSDEAAAGLTAEALREAWTGDQKDYIEGIVQAVKSAMSTAQIEETGDRAAMPYGAGGTVLFVREDGQWKIEDFR